MVALLSGRVLRQGVEESLHALGACWVHCCPDGTARCDSWNEHLHPHRFFSYIYSSKECEDLKKENKYLSSEIHMERIMMRTESELTMRNLRSLNQELQAEVKELKQKLHLSQQRVTMCSKAVEEADKSRSEAEKNRTLAEARALGSKGERDAALADKVELSEELHNLSKEHKNTQLLLAQTEKKYFETMLKLDRVSGEKEFLLKESKELEDERSKLRQNIKELTDENATIKEKEVIWRRRAAAAEEQSERAIKEQQQAEHECRLAKREKDKSVSECLSWREKHQALADIFREQEDLISQRQNKAVSHNNGPIIDRRSTSI
ncbi:uncharacterized protein LOC132851110 [Tachysurus vachellii]|uniref:uncharacterized protein LOC132851110 n=1 Tax=Tachysurus vachellii TaxID=175792 RepID=UPI00296B5405|nr:uncharacterized protein LOC132851110 [Tachysurus vachellii]